MSLLQGASILALAAYAGVAEPQALADPTRPPSVTPASATSSGAEASGLPRLQSILISPQRRLAVIDGRTVGLGENLNGATLVQIAETHVTLRQGTELKTLELYPGLLRKAQKPREADKKGQAQ